MKHYIEKLSKRQKQWAWFALLWCGGLFSMFVLGSLIKWMMGV